MSSRLQVLVSLLYSFEKVNMGQRDISYRAGKTKPPISGGLLTSKIYRGILY